MPQVAHPTTHIGTGLREHRQVAIAALLALMATAVVVLALSSGSDPSTSSFADQPAVRASGGPSETRIAAAVGSAPAVAAPDEGSIAAAIGSAREPAPTATGPDESKVAAAITGR